MKLKDRYRIQLVDTAQLTKKTPTPLSLFLSKLDNEHVPHLFDSLYIEYKYFRKQWYWKQRRRCKKIHSEVTILHFPFVTHADLQIQQQIMFGIDLNRLDANPRHFAKMEEKLKTIFPGDYVLRFIPHRTFPIKMATLFFKKKEEAMLFKLTYPSSCYEK